MTLEISINGTPFTRWESASVQRSIDANCGVFRFTNSSEAPVFDYPVKAGDFVEILVSSVRKIVGFVDEVIGLQDDNSHTITVSGRDVTADIIDSSIPDGAKVTEGPISLRALCEKMVSELGVELPIVQQFNDIAGFTSEDLQAGGSGESAMGYLVSFARKRQVYLISDGNGNLVIYRPDTSDKAGTPLLHQFNGARNNVMSYSFKRSLQDRFNRYLCRSQDNFGFDSLADYSEGGVDRKNEVTDEQVRPGRYLEISAEESMTDEECKERAAEESNLRRALGTEYTATVCGFTEAGGLLWDFGRFVDIIDDYAGMTGNFLIKSVEYSLDTRAGGRTVLTCVPPDAYQVQAGPPTKSRRGADTGTAYQNETPPGRGGVR